MMKSSGSGGIVVFSISYGVVESSESEVWSSAEVEVSDSCSCLGGSATSPSLSVDSSVSGVCSPSLMADRSEGAPVCSIVLVTVGMWLNTGHRAKLSLCCCQFRAIADIKSSSNVASSAVTMFLLPRQ
jgi:hypothetical protein